MRRLATAAPAALLALAVSAGCSGSGDTADDAAETAGGSATGSSTESAAADPEGTDATDGGTRPATVDGLPVPAGVELTEEGSELSFGDRAQVAYVPRQGQVAALALQVRKVEVTDWRTSFEGFRPPAEEVTPYFVRVSVHNIGETGLARRPVPLYAADADGRLFEPSAVEGDFKPCAPGRLPKRFAPGAEPAKVCLVYLLPAGAALDAVAFRPTQQYGAITWTGEVEDISKEPEDDATGSGETDGNDSDQGDDG